MTAVTAIEIIVAPESGGILVSSAHSRRQLEGDLMSRADDAEVAAVERRTSVAITEPLTVPSGRPRYSATSSPRIGVDEFPARVAARYWALFEAAEQRTRRIIESQAETQFSRSSEWLPPWPIHRWESELFEIAVQNSASEIVPNLAGDSHEQITILQR